MGNKKYKLILFLGLSVIVFGLVTLYFYTRDEKVYTLKSYDSDTKETNILQYVIRGGDTITHGKSIYYNEKGNKIYQNNWVNGKIFGNCIDYFENGNIKSIHYMKNSKIRSEATWNYPNGNVERYILYNDFGRATFLIFFDEQGDVKSYRGLPFVEIYQYKIAHKEQFKIKINQVLSVGDTLIHKYLLANIPKATRSLKIKLIDPDLLGNKSKIVKNQPVGINATDVLTKKGVYAIKGVVEYKFDDIKKTVIKDSIYFEVNVN